MVGSISNRVDNSFKASLQRVKIWVGLTALGYLASRLLRGKMRLGHVS